MAQDEGGAGRRSSSGLNDNSSNAREGLGIDCDSRELRRELFDDSIRSVRDSSSRTDEGKKISYNFMTIFNKRARIH
jgi:hypothetical protein